MVLVILNNIKFEAEKFETRTMPTPDLKSKEMIYWIRINTQDRRLVLDLHRFLEGVSKTIELHVPSAFIAVKTELESYRPSAVISAKESSTKDSPSLHEKVSSGEDSEEEKYIVEIVLRRLLPESKSGQTLAPYG